MTLISILGPLQRCAYGDGGTSGGAPRLDSKLLAAKATAIPAAAGRAENISATIDVRAKTIQSGFSLAVSVAASQAKENPALLQLEKPAANISTRPKAVATTGKVRGRTTSSASAGTRSWPSPSTIAAVVSTTVRTPTSCALKVTADPTGSQLGFWRWPPAPPMR